MFQHKLFHVFWGNVTWSALRPNHHFKPLRSQPFLQAIECVLLVVR